MKPHRACSSSLRDSRHSTKVIACLGIVYLVWGSSFLFTKIAVENLPPALFAGIRFVTAGVLLALLAEFYGGGRLPTRLTEWRHVTIAGFFMVFVSNGLNTWSIQYLPSNEAALLNGTSAFWIAGLGVLTACASWSLGTLYYRSITTQLSSMMFMALQMLMGGLMLLTVALARGDSIHWPPNPPGLIALFYLTFLSSGLAYTAYGWLTMHTTPTILSTYSYVNPAIAALLGWLVLHEHLSGLQLVGMAIIIVGVCILTVPGGSLTDPKTLAEPKTQ